MKGVSLYSGAGGFDVGFKKAGFEIIFANDFDKSACETYRQNFGNHVRHGDIHKYTDELFELCKGVDIDVVFGGPPCQGFSVAGKMNPDDPRSEHIWTFAKVIENVRPKAFVMENVKALAVLTKFEALRTELLARFRGAGYSVNFVVLNATDFDVPQSRDRVFFIGFKNDEAGIPDLDQMLEPFKKKAQTVRKALSVLDPVGTGNNASICNAKVTLSGRPVLRKSPYAGMLFNGMGRPVKIDGYSNTLPASMGGNKTPIIDNDELYEKKPSWIEDYHSKIWDGSPSASLPLELPEVPSRLRRLTVEEAAVLQTFPLTHKFYGPQTAKFKQIGNAVPCNLGYGIARMVMNYLKKGRIQKVVEKLPRQLELYPLEMAII